tara:strand:+ start:29 stop:2224 length:2196 start_codon:yes stop_codon:yes gene_type:complete
MFQLKYLNYKEKYLDLKLHKGGTNKVIMNKKMMMMKEEVTKLREELKRLKESNKLKKELKDSQLARLPSTRTTNIYEQLNQIINIQMQLYTSNIMKLKKDISASLNKIKNQGILILTPGIGTSGTSTKKLKGYLPENIIYSRKMQEKGISQYSDISRYSTEDGFQCGEPKSGFSKNNQYDEGFGNYGWLIAGLEDTFTNVHVFVMENSGDEEEVAEWLSDNIDGGKNIRTVIVASKGGLHSFPIISTHLKSYSDFRNKLNIVFINGAEEETVSPFNPNIKSDYNNLIQNYVLTSHNSYPMNMSIPPECNYNVLFYHKPTESHECPNGLMKFNDNIINNNRFTKTSDLVHLILSLYPFGLDTEYRYFILFKSLYKWIDNTTNISFSIKTTSGRIDNLYDDTISVIDKQLEKPFILDEKNIINKTTRLYKVPDNKNLYNDPEIQTNFPEIIFPNTNIHNWKHYIHLDKVKQLQNRFGKTIQLKDLMKPASDGNYYIYHGSTMINPDDFRNFDITPKDDDSSLIRSTTKSIRPAIDFSKGAGQLGHGFYFTINYSDALNYACQPKHTTNKYSGIYRIKLTEYGKSLHVTNYLWDRNDTTQLIIPELNNINKIIFKNVPIAHDSMYMSTTFRENTFSFSYANIPLFEINKYGRTLRSSQDFSDKYNQNRHLQFCLSDIYLKQNNINYKDFSNLMFDDIDIIMFDKSKIDVNRGRYGDIGSLGSVDNMVSEKCNKI